MLRATPRPGRSSQGAQHPRAWPRGLIPSRCGRPPPAAPHPVLGAAAWGPVRRRHLSPRALPACGSVAGAASGLGCARPAAVLLRPGSLSGRDRGLCWTPALCWVPSQGPRRVSFLSEGGRCGRVLRREAAGCSSAPSSSPTPPPPVCAQHGVPGPHSAAAVTLVREGTRPEEGVARGAGGWPTADLDTSFMSCPFLSQ